MNRNFYLKFILTVIALLLAVSGYLIVEALDRVRATNILLLDKLAKLEAAPAAAAAVSPAAGKPIPAPAEIANARFFDPAAQPGGRLIEAEMADPPGLNPVTVNENSAAAFNALCTSSLGERRWDAPEEFRPLLAESWEISPDHKVYRIRLRKGVMWQGFTDPVTGKKVPPREVTAHDFRFFVDVVRDPDVNCAPLRVYYQELDALEVVSDHEFLVRWKSEYYGSLSSTLGMTPLPRHFYAPDGKFDGKAFNDDHRRNRMIVGCGPYQFVRWEKEKRLVFRRNPGYFGNALGAGPSIENLVFEIIKLPNTRFQALLGNSLDRLALTPDQWVNRTKLPEFQQEKLKRFQYLLPSYSYIGYNLRRPCFADAETRRALTLLTDREKLRKDIFYGLAEIVAGPFFLRSRYASPDIKPWPYDPAEAKRLLKKAGWRDTDGDGILERNGVKFVFTMMQIAGSTMQSRMMPVLKESFAAAGIDMKIQNLEWSVFLQRIDARNYDACCLGWSSTFDPDLYQVWHSSQTGPGGSNHIGYCNQETDRLIEEMRRCFDVSKRIELAHRIGKILHEEQPYTFLFTPYSLVAMSGRYRNVRIFPGGMELLPVWVPKEKQLRVPSL